MSEPDRCEHCGAALRKYWKPITPGLVDILIKFRSAVVSNNRNRIHLLEDMSLNNVEYTNFQKLRYHGLVAKYKEKNEQGELVWQRGYWLLTRRGVQFLRNEIAIPHKVQTLRNRVVDHDARLVTVSDVIGSVPYNETIDDLEWDRATKEEAKQVSLL